MRMNLKVFRVLHNLTQSEMAERIGCSRASYSAIESGAREGRQKFWRKLQEVFEVPDAEMWSLKKNE